jgi:hypothetical protein
MADPIRLYLDEDAMRASFVRALRARQVDVSTAYEADLIGRPDEQHLEYATSQARVLLTFNRGDFARLHSARLAQGRSHAGIIVSDQLETGVIVRRVLRLLAARSASHMQNWLEYLSNWR